ncbi:ABC transporter permease [Cognatishimia sp. 1_MG-2023]|uniref:ABC transporter permease n=1 Tax=Cognatishimia sp. 1_MG-2023 TaxID=3062642 RepID=UPI0026E458C8|nr:ABC transporter permease [Cognatishimia sp. 1_MG-2023]MDO6728198.1 ABC transporter permease [Cognatishimia sp. 1_MG-2023]
MGKLISRIFMGTMALWIALPILVVCAAALNGGRTMFFPPEDPTLQRFVEFFVTEEIWIRSLQNSLIIAFGSASLAVLAAWPIAYWLWRKADRFSKLLAGLASMPFALPPIIFGVGLVFFWGFSGSLGEIWSGIVSHAALFIALPLTTLSIGLQSLDRSHLDAAATMGATESTAFRTVILPQMLPFTASGFFFAVVLSFNEFIVVFFVSASAYSTVTVQIFNSLRNGFTPTMAVGAITFISASILIFSLIARFGNLPQLLGADKSK